MALPPHFGWQRGSIFCYVSTIFYPASSLVKFDVEISALSLSATSVTCDILGLIFLIGLAC